MTQHESRSPAWLGVLLFSSLLLFACGGGSQSTSTVDEWASVNHDHANSRVNPVEALRLD